VPKYHNIEVELTGRDGNAFAVMGAVTKALRRNKVPQAEIDQYTEQAMSGDYDNLLVVTMQTVEVL